MITLKTVAWDNNRRKFCSPSHTEFTWEFDGITWGVCEKCAPNGTIGLDCTCGIYSAPNPEALEEYEHYPTSIIVMLRMYGRYDIWSGPSDLSWTYPTRCDGARVIGVVGTGSLISKGFLKGTRGITEVLALDKFKMNGTSIGLYPWGIVRNMLQRKWIECFGIDPYADLRAR